VTGPNSENFAGRQSANTSQAGQIMTRLFIKPEIITRKDFPSDKKISSGE